MLSQDTIQKSEMGARGAMLGGQKKSTVRMLFIEDNESDFHVLKKHAEATNGPRKYELDWASSYQQGLRKLESEHYDLVMVDYVLDESNGIELVKSLNSVAAYPPFILMTHYDDYRYYDDSVEAGFYDYLIKGEVTPSLLDRFALYAIERRKVETKLRYERQCFLYALERLPYVVLRTDITFRITDTNKRGLDMFGCEQSDLVGAGVFDFIQTPHKQEIIDQFFSGHHQAVSFTSLIQKEVSERSSVSDKTVLWDCLYRDFESEKGYLFIGKDISDQLRIEPSDDETPETLDAALSRAARSFGNKS
tara:strand:- start:282 stop:1199 length:918 start_codon:yes stop_codon:yes gene_type:complete